MSSTVKLPGMLSEHGTNPLHDETLVASLVPDQPRKVFAVFARIRDRSEIGELFLKGFRRSCRQHQRVLCAFEEIGSSEKVRQLDKGFV